MASPTTAPAPPATALVATVAFDNLPFHHTGTREYQIPPELAADTAIGCRIKARFGRGTVRTGYVTAIRPAAEDDMTLPAIAELVSPVPVLTSETIRAASAIADRYAGTLGDMLDLTVPERRIKPERDNTTSPLPVTAPKPAAWDAYTRGPAFLAALHAGKNPRAVWNTRPAENWAERFAEAAATSAAAGKAAVLIVPDQARLTLLDAALTKLLGRGRHVTLTSSMGSTPRYAAYLKAVRGDVLIVAGTRSAALTPVTDLGLVAIWDDGDIAHIEQRQPYPHARDMLLTRAHLVGAAALIGGNARTPQAHQLVETGWAQAITPAARGPQGLRVLATGSDAHLASDGTNTRIPTFAWKAAKTALAAGRAVLVQVPRTGYIPLLFCRACRTRATCPACGGTLARTNNRTAPSCTTCHRTDAGNGCPACGAPHLSATVIGTERTAWELKRAFPDATVVESTGEHRLTDTPDRPAVVVATPGAEPSVPGGYGAVILLDAWVQLSGTKWNASEQVVRQWMNAAALAAPKAAVAVVADESLPQVQALARWDAGWFAERELAERAELGFPPAARWAAITGPIGNTDIAAKTIPEHLGADLLGPFPASDDTEQLLVRVDRAKGLALAEALAVARSTWTAEHRRGISVRLDPLTIT
ncbi:primosome assembly protein PriA [Glycomyces sp. YM15]|uniref:primosomal protein N' family DNA-binding protein n=1 Tax=Glycomyces sp. YM15 TaxID=2800446 RepID=UPI0019646656|nr:primosome assembly protein PriA [Glycomyces sp. YM15]